MLDFTWYLSLSRFVVECFNTGALFRLTTRDSLQSDRLDDSRQCTARRSPTAVSRGPYIPVQCVLLLLATLAGGAGSVFVRAADVTCSRHVVRCPSKFYNLSESTGS